MRYPEAGTSTPFEVLDSRCGVWTMNPCGTYSSDRQGNVFPLPPTATCDSLRRMARLTRAITDLAVMAAPFMCAIAAIVGTLLFWPGAVIGIAILLAIGWFCQKQIVKIKSEHHS